MNLSEIDLNHLVLFHQLMIERRVFRVAENLGMTQPAVSNTLAKLRRQFGDELFVKTHVGMMPTPFAEQLAEPIGYALGMIQSGLNQHRAFDPATLKRTINLSLTDIGEVLLLPSLVDRLRRDAPGIKLCAVNNSATSLRDDMEAGKVDLAIGPLPQLKAGFFQTRLFHQRYVCLFRKGHPIESQALTLARFKAQEHLVVASVGTGYAVVDDLLRRSGIERQVHLTLPHFLSVGELLRRTELVATVPERLAKHLAGPFGLAYRAIPIDLPAITTNVFWHAKVHRSPTHQWLRSVVLGLFGNDAPAD
jgi:DNA-binding transcriptional LysR family regulator